MNFLFLGITIAVGAIMYVLGRIYPPRPFTPETLALQVQSFLAERAKQLVLEGKVASIDAALLQVRKDFSEACFSHTVNPTTGVEVVVIDAAQEFN